MGAVRTVALDVVGVVVGFLVIQWILKRNAAPAEPAATQFRSPVSGKAVTAIENRPWLNA